MKIRFVAAVVGLTALGACTDTSQTAAVSDNTCAPAAAMYVTRCPSSNSQSGGRACARTDRGIVIGNRKHPTVGDVRLIPAYFTEENDVGARIALVTLATMAPFASVCARACNQSGSTRNAPHFRSRSASNSHASR